MKRVRDLFPQVDRCMVVGDRGMLSKSNTEALAKLGFGHVIAAPLKREKIVRDVIEQTHEELVEKARELQTKTAKGERLPEAFVERQAEVAPGETEGPVSAYFCRRDILRGHI